jgi:hypothetical protein
MARATIASGESKAATGILGFLLALVVGCAPAQPPHQVRGGPSDPSLVRGVASQQTDPSLAAPPANASAGEKASRTADSSSRETEPDKEGPGEEQTSSCERWDFFSNLARLHTYDGDFDLSKVPEVSELGLEAIAKAFYSQVEFTQLKDGIARVPEAQLLEEVRRRQGRYYSELMSLGYWLRRTDRDEVRVSPFEPGTLLFVGSRYQVRLLGDFCSGEIVEIRNTGGTYARPRWPKKGQIGFDCTHDRSVADEPPDPALVLRALRKRSEATPGKRLSHVVFPNSATPMIREVQRTSDSCKVLYLGATPSFDTCDEPKLRLTEMGTDCCSAEDCADDTNAQVRHSFLQFVDALSLRDSQALRRQIAPGTKTVFGGNVFDEPFELTATTSAKALQRFWKQAPGWAGTDSFDCQLSRDDRAQCWFGGGGTMFTVTLVANAARDAWYVSEVIGDHH